MLTRPISVSKAVSERVSWTESRVGAGLTRRTTFHLWLLEKGALHSQGKPGSSRPSRQTPLSSVPFSFLPGRALKARLNGGDGTSLLPTGLPVTLAGHRGTVIPWVWTTPPLLRPHYSVQGDLRPRCWLPMWPISSLVQLLLVADHISLPRK